MCGILVYLGRQALGVEHPSIATIGNRGPDDKGVRCFEVNGRHLTLGHRRLSIIDLSAEAAQPMCYEKSGLWVVFNGEIYNYIELRRELETAGYLFRSDSDTEVLLASYDRWGRSCLDRFNGMFAFAIWDSKARKLFVARDRYGIKPLYYYNSSSGFALASEIKQFVNLPGFQASVCPETLVQYLQYGDFAYDERTLWDQAMELEPGMSLELTLDTWTPGQTVVPRKWYDLGDFLHTQPIGEREAAEKLRFLLEDSVRLRMRADVQVGVLLSGGVDSSSITCLLDSNFGGGYPLRSFSARFNEEAFDEGYYIEQVLRHVEAKSHMVFLHSADMCDGLDEVITNLDLPSVGGSTFAHFLLYKRVAQTATKVTLEGQGADEILGGYGAFRWAYLAELLMSGRVRACCREYAASRRSLQGSVLGDARDLVGHILFKPIWRAKNNLLGELARSSYFDFRSLGVGPERLVPEVVRNSLSMASAHKTRFTILRAILHTVDRASMAHSVEARVPFLDHRIVEFCLSLPIDLKIRDGVRKLTLRQSMRDVLPPGIFERRDKVGFSAPASVWAKGELRDFYRERLLSLRALPFVRSGRVLERFDEFLRGEIPYDRTFWRLICLSRWLSLFKVSV